jgi:uncharacterized protein YndB with AHSA1/START domain
VTYIATTPEKLWQALTSGVFTRQYWFGRRVESDWQQGSKVTYWIDESQADFTGKVLRVEPHRLLSFTFQPEANKALREEPPSRVTFEIEPVGTSVKLTTTHDELVPGGKVFEGISSGWPVILSTLKTLLETGKPLPIDTKIPGDCPSTVA